MKKIKLTQNKTTLVDDEDYEKLLKSKWYAYKAIKSNAYYARRASKNKGVIHMHREIMNCPKGKVVDHIDGNGLNNQKNNLRICSHSQNQMNRGKSPRNTSGYKGVFSVKTGGWIAQIAVNKRTIYLGYYKSIEDAYAAYCRGANKYHRKYAPDEIKKQLSTN